MSAIEYLDLSPSDRIAIERLSCGIVATLEHRFIFSPWQTTGLSGAGGTRLGAIQHLEQQLQRTAAAVSSTFAAEVSA